MLNGLTTRGTKPRPSLQGKLYIVTEYAANGNLHDYIKKQKSRLTEELIWKLYIQVGRCGFLTPCQAGRLTPALFP